MEIELVGRDEELAAVDALLEAQSGVLLLEGEAGIGKTSVWNAGVARARDAGYRVLVTRPAQAEAQISFAAVADLLEGLSDVLATLPKPQQHALEIALLVRDPGDRPPQQHEIAFALLSVLRACAQEVPLLVAVDDIQWLDRPSASTLQFALRRLDGERAAVLLARRTDGKSETPLELERMPDERLRRVPLEGLSLGALQRVLHERLGVSFARPLLRRVHELSGGNPFFALELAQFVQREHLDEHSELPLPETLHELVRSRLAELPAATADALVVAAASSAPTPELVEQVTRADSAAILRPAVEANVISIDSGRIQFTHPVLARAAYEEVGPGRRREVHRALASLVSDPEERARHLALSESTPSPELAAVVRAGALDALSRGAPSAAADLLQHALRLLPDRDEVRAAWTYELADAMYTAGDAARARELLRELAEQLPRGRGRARVLLRLGLIEGELAGSTTELEIYERALPEAEGDDALTAALEVGIARMRTFGGAPLVGVDHAQRAVEIAERVGDPQVLAEALAVFVQANRYAGRTVDRALIERAVELERSLPHVLEVASPSSIYSLELRTNLELDRAREILEQHLEQVTTLGDETAEPMVVFRLFDTELLSGRWERAEWCAARMRELAEPSGVSREYARLATALVDAHRGRVDEARAAARAGLEFAETQNEPPLAHHNLALLGFIELSAGNAAAAADLLVRWEGVVRGLNFRDPYHLLRGVLNEAEALVEVGRLAEAATALDWFVEAARESDRDWPLTLAVRPRAVLTAAEGDLESALKLLEPLSDEAALTALPFERARAVLALGVVRRRAKQRRAARAALESARDAFASLGAPLWEEKATAELARIGGRAPAGAELTTTEQRIAELVAGGKTNKEVAAELFVTVHTVEAALTRIYGKLDVRSRSQLAGKLAGKL